MSVPIDLTFEFTDTDGVSGQRHVVIKPTPDVPPDVNVQIEVLRKTSQGYMCTFTALVPFSGTVRDDHGLADVEYVYNVTQLESASKANKRTARAVDLLARAARAGPEPAGAGALGRGEPGPR